MSNHLTIECQECKAKYAMPIGVFGDVVATMTALNGLHDREHPDCPTTQQPLEVDGD